MFPGGAGIGAQSSWQRRPSARRSRKQHDASMCLTNNTCLMNEAHVVFGAEQLATAAIDTSLTETTRHLYVSNEQHLPDE
jgi:hypothetical protein